MIVSFNKHLASRAITSSVEFFYGKMEYRPRGRPAGELLEQEREREERRAIEAEEEEEGDVLEYEEYYEEVLEEVEEEEEEEEEDDERMEHEKRQDWEDKRKSSAEHLAWLPRPVRWVLSWWGWAMWPIMMPVR